MMRNVRSYSRRDGTKVSAHVRNINHSSHKKMDVDKLNLEHKKVNSEDIYKFVYTFLRNKNKKKITYYDDEEIVEKAKSKFGSSNKVESNALKAFYNYYESDEFMDKLDFGGKK